MKSLKTLTMNATVLQQIDTMSSPYPMKFCRNTMFSFESFGLS